MKLNFKEKNIEFWCSICDAYLVNIDKPESGRFYTTSGHKLDWKNGEVLIEEEETVIFAICNDCRLVSNTSNVERGRFSSW